MDVFEMTQATLIEEGFPQVAAALAALGPNRAGDPPLGYLGWLPYADRFALACAANTAHCELGTAGWTFEGDPAALSDAMFDRGGWRREASGPQVARAQQAWVTAGGSWHPARGARA